MNWLAPLLLEEPKRVVLRRDGAVMPDTSKECVIDGVRYRSMADACRALGWSYSKVYYAIGESWRCRGAS